GGERAREASCPIMRQGARGTGVAGTRTPPSGRFSAAPDLQALCNATRHATEAHAEERGARVLRVRDRSSGPVLQPAEALLVAAGEAPDAGRARRCGPVVSARPAYHPGNRRLVPGRRLLMAVLVRQPV